MEFNGDGLLSNDSIIQLLEIERQSRRLAESHAHNMDAGRIAQLGRSIANHCLCSVAARRALLEQEGALNTEIGEFLKSQGYSIEKLDSRGTSFRRSIIDGRQTAIEGVRSDHSPSVISDLVIDKTGDRVELKTAAFATPKDRVPSDLFEKDLAYLERHPANGDLERHQWEGLSRGQRLAELAIFVADKKVAQGSSRLQNMIGDIDIGGRKNGTTNNGITYEIYIGKYADGEILDVQRKKPISIKDFIVLLAYPSLQS